MFKKPLKEKGKQSARRCQSRDSPSQIYWRKPKRRQLILYIIRIPGTRDLCLTPIKPRSDVVSEEDVTSCLYYIHDLLAASGDGNSPSTASSFVVNRDPVEFATGDGAATLQEARATLAGPVVGDVSPAVRRKPLHAISEPLGSLPSAFPNVPTVSRPRPEPALPPRPTGPRPIPPGLPARPRSVPSPPVTPQRRPVCAPRQPNAIDGRSEPPDSGPPPSHPPRRVLRPDLSRHRISLTIVRRDTSQNKQANVGRVLQSNESNRAAPLDLHLTPPEGGDSPPSQIRLHTAKPFRSTKKRDIFRGDLHVRDTGFWMQHILFGTEQRCVFTTGISARSTKCYLQPLSPAQSLPVDPRSLLLSELRFNTQTQTAHQSRPFRMHARTEGDSASNALNQSPHQRLRDRISRLTDPEGTQAQLRSRGSHYPPVSLFSPTNHMRLEAPKINAAGSGDDELPAALDLSLGRERQGGGLMGNKTKLGKLVVEAQGLGVLDAIVAANMAVWWTVFEAG